MPKQPEPTMRMRFSCADMIWGIEKCADSEGVIKVCQRRRLSLIKFGSVPTS